VIELPLQFPWVHLLHPHRRRIRERDHHQGNRHDQNPHLKEVKQVNQQDLYSFKFLVFERPSSCVTKSMH